jgi:hypothetical protein
MMSRTSKLKKWILRLKEKGEPDEPECSIRLNMEMRDVAKELKLNIDLNTIRIMYDPLYQTFRFFKIIKVNGVKYYVGPENMTFPLWMMKVYSEDEICQYLIKILKDLEAAERWRV